MLLLVPEAGKSAVAAEFPFTIGRSSSAGMRLNSLGVWDVHVSIRVQEGRFFVQPEGQALLLVNGVRSEGGILRVGDELAIGAERVTVALAPAAQQGLSARETLNWLFIAAVVCTQVLLFLSIR